jgi:DNA repair exonuclease SbcCD nuclease subunit
VRFVHAADIHLDSPLRGLDRYEGAPAGRFRDATRHALENLVELCLVERVDFLVIAGDLYDGNWKDYKTGLFFAAQMAKLRAGGVRVFLVRGNHDAESQITRTLRLPENVHVFDGQRAETVRLESLGVALHGQSFVNRVVSDDLAAAYPDALPGLFNLGVLHTSATGRPGHDTYAPCTLETLRGRGYDYWALGHVHKREVLSEEPYVLYPGNLQGRHARETGEKGATLVSVEGGRIVSVEPRALDVVRWAVCEVDAAGALSTDEVLDRVRDALTRAAFAADGRMLAARVLLTGATRIHAALAGDVDRWHNEIRNLANDLGGGEGVWVEKIRLETRAALDLADLAEREDAVGQLVRALAELRSDEAAQRALLESVAELKPKLLPELREGDDGLRLDDPQLVAALLDDVEQLLLPRLLRGEGGA